MAIDANGNIDVQSSSTSEFRVEVFSSLGGFRGGWADATGGHAICSYFNSLAIDSNENLYIADSSNHRILKYLLNG